MGYLRIFWFVKLLIINTNIDHGPSGSEIWGCDSKHPSTIHILKVKVGTKREVNILCALLKPFGNIGVMLYVYARHHYHQPEDIKQQNKTFS